MENFGEDMIEKMNKNRKVMYMNFKEKSNNRENIKLVDYTFKDPEICRDLCNRLMKHQAENSVKYKEILEKMNFDNRLALSFEKNEDKYLLVAMDGDVAVGYVFALIETVTEASKSFMPSWTKVMTKEDREAEGFYRKDLETPCVMGSIHNLYVLPEYRGLNIADQLMVKALEWIRSYEKVEKISVMVSNGNKVGSFYERYGFKFDHEIFGGFIIDYLMDK